MVIFPGAEVHINDLLLDAEILRESNILTVNGGKKYILLEFPFQWVPPKTEQIIFKLKSMGFTPILPHLERNYRIQRNPNMVVHFVEMGAILQVTAQSITGDFDAAAVLLVTRHSTHVTISKKLTKTCPHGNGEKKFLQGNTIVLSKFSERGF